MPPTCATARQRQKLEEGGEVAAPLLEFLTLASSARIVGTAGSSFAAEAACFGNVQRLTLGDWGTYSSLAPATRVFGTRNVSRPGR